MLFLLVDYIILVFNSQGQNLQMQFMRTNLVKTSEEKKEMLGIVLQNSRMSEFVE